MKRYNRLTARDFSALDLNICSGWRRRVTRMLRNGASPKKIYLKATGGDLHVLAEAIHERLHGWTSSSFGVFVRAAHALAWAKAEKKFPEGTPGWWAKQQKLATAEMRKKVTYKWVRENLDKLIRRQKEWES